MRLIDAVAGTGVTRAFSPGTPPWNYADWTSAAFRLARGLKALGLARGDVVTAWFPNSPVWPVVELACAAAGVALLGVPPQTGPLELDTLFAVVRPRLVLHGPSWHHDALTGVRERLARNGAHAIAIPTVDVEPDPAWASLLDHRPLPYEGRSDDPLCLFVTSGTTASPKVVVHTQDGIAWHAIHAGRALGLRSDDVMLCALPLQGVFGHTALWSILASGGEAVILPVLDANRALHAIQVARCTCMVGTDAMLRHMMDIPAASDRLRTLSWGAFAAFQGAADTLVSAADGIGLPLFQVYGSTESQALTAVWSPSPPADVRAVAGGRLVDPDMQARVVQEDTSEPVAPGRTGHLELRGRSIFRCYRSNDTATRAALDAEGWYRTGDRASVDSEGNIRFHGRISDAMRLGGYLVHPAEIEEVLRSHPAVLDARVVSGAQPGERDRAVGLIRLRNGATIDHGALRAWCEQRLARHKVPRVFVEVPNFPQRNGANGTKVQRMVLTQWARDALGTTGRKPTGSRQGV